jgi:excisionase family DNA binding protein
MGKALSPKQVAQVIGVSEATLKRWCDRGLIDTQRTSGGHRRITEASVLDYLKARQLSPARPDLLGLPSAKGAGLRALENAAEVVALALEHGDEERMRRLLFDFHMAGRTVHELGDRVLSKAFRALGERWQHGDMEVYQERRACEIVMRWIHEVRRLLRAPEPDAPLALGGTPEGDPYEIANALVELSLREQGWRAESLGCSMPLATLAAAARRERPKLFWLSASNIASPREDFIDGYRSFYKAASEAGSAVAIGGRAWSDDLRRQVPYDGYADTLTHLISFARAVGRS